MQIKELSDRSGASVRSIRYYEKAGLLTGARASNGYRQFDELAIQRVKNIKALLAVGLTVDDVRSFQDCLDGDVTTATPAPEKIAIARSRLNDLERRRDELAAACDLLRDALTRGVHQTSGPLHG